MNDIFENIAEYAVDYVLDKLREDEFKKTVVDFLKEKAQASETGFDDAAVSIFEAAWNDAVIEMIESFIKEQV